jgi:LuxR family transcriptional regulator, maltose regulon positive regulatory protein
MAAPILATKLFIPLPRPAAVPRPRLIERLNESLSRKLTLVSAPAGFGKTTLLAAWLAGAEPRVRTAWLSLEEGDSDPTRFLTYFVAALQTVSAHLGERVLAVLGSPQPPSSEALLTALLNEIVTIPDEFVLVLDDYHAIDSRPVDQALAFLLDHLPPHMHLVIATRQDPQLPLARYRTRGDLTELRAADLRFTTAETAAFLNQGLRLNLSPEHIAALEARTEGWIAGLQLAAISMQGQEDVASFIKSFTGSHHFVLDYLVEEVLQRQPESVQSFLLQTSILDRLCGPLCDALLQAAAPSGQETLETLERANLFLVPLDNERRWYRYHHLFADLLRQRLQQAGARDGEMHIAALHNRASQWYEENGLEIDAFQHAAAAHNIDRAARLVEGKGMPLQFRGAVAPVLSWLETLPEPELDARPTLWVMYASALSMTGQLAGVEQKLQAAEAALQNAAPDGRTRNLIGHIAAIRALLAAAQNQIEASIAQSHRALEYLHPDNLAVRTATIWKLGIAYRLQGDLAAAARAYAEAVSISQATGNLIIRISAGIGLGSVQEAQNQLSLAAQTYRNTLQIVGDAPQPAAGEAFLGLARICYEWNDLAAAQQYAQQSLQVARLYDRALDGTVSAQVFLARLKLAQGDVPGADVLLSEAEQATRQVDAGPRVPDVTAVRLLALLRQGRLAAAAALARTCDFPIGQARVCLAQGEISAALALLEAYRRQVEARAWPDERLKVTVLQAAALSLHGEREQALRTLGEALALAEPGGFIRTFVDEGDPMARLLSDAAARGIQPEYVARLLAAFQREQPPNSPARQANPAESEDKSGPPHPQPLIEPLSQREIEILGLIAQGLSNREICERLFLALNTVKGHNRVIFDKLQVQNRTEAVARARELNLL